MQHDILLENRHLDGVNPLICGFQDCEPSHSYGPYAREYWLLHYVLSGKGIYETVRGVNIVREGQLFVIRPDEITTYTADKRDPWHYCWIGFQTSLDVEPLLGEDVITAPECAHIFHAFQDSGHIRFGRELYICGKIFELLSLLSVEAAPVEDATIHYVRMAQNYIESNYERELRVDKLAGYLNLDRTYFSKLFRRHTGKSPQRYIVDFRLEKAAELIATRGFAPGEAAQLTGYSDIVNFSRMFKRKFGVPPSAYRLK
ncbi:AraC family transcriptional regulator [Ruminococcaceae bacterium OttesenSCG-928-L11]|nr:AraC family transcriptional regulator [Ruminococcaceae bacterium OttesenSCG-928-L11]